MILTPILLLNMLIASMGNTYQRIITISEKERIRQVCERKQIKDILFLTNYSCLIFFCHSSGLSLF